MCGVEAGVLTLSNTGVAIMIDIGKGLPASPFRSGDFVPEKAK
jgi:hypothetical protein